MICFPEVSFDTFFPQYRADRRYFPPRGQVIGRASCAAEALLLVDCDLDLMEQARQEMPFLRDRRRETYGCLAQTPEAQAGRE